VTRTLLEGETQSRDSVTNIGVRPTFNGSSLTVETHLLEDPGSIHPSHIELRFWKRLRDEKKFNNADELRAQIARDIAGANRFFSRLRRFRSVHQPA
jgi:riboflavin kinase/FMN adenylyltransferase